MKFSIFYLLFIMLASCDSQSDYEFYKNPNFDLYNARLPLSKPFEMVGPVGPAGKINAWQLVDLKDEQRYNDFYDDFFSKVAIIQSNIVILAQPNDSRWLIIDVQRRSKYYFTSKRSFDSTLSKWNITHTALMDIDSIYNIFKKTEILPNCWPKYDTSQPWF